MTARPVVRARLDELLAQDLPPDAVSTEPEPVRAAAQVWNATVASRPVAAARCTTRSEVQAAVRATQSGAVRLVDRLAAAGLVSRVPGQDRRSRSVRLTEDGHRQSGVISESRSAYLLALTVSLSPAEVATLRDLLGRVMKAVVTNKDGGPWTCRLCDLVACRREQGECPTYNAALATRA